MYLPTCIFFCTYKHFLVLQENGQYEVWNSPWNFGLGDHSPPGLAGNCPSVVVPGKLCVFHHSFPSEMPSLRICMAHDVELTLQPLSPQTVVFPLELTN